MWYSSTLQPHFHLQSRPWDHQELGSAKQIFLLDQLQWRALTVRNKRDRSAELPLEGRSGPKEGMFIRAKHTQAGAGRFESNKKKTKLHIPSFFSQPYRSNKRLLLPWREVCERKRKKWKAPYSVTWDHWKILLPIVRENRKKVRDNLIL